MKFTYKPPEWENSGSEPPEELRRGGFTAGYKPPAAFFNWFFNGVYRCLEEIHDKVVGLDEKTETTRRVLFGGGDTALNNMDTLFVVDDTPDTTHFWGASYSNMEFSNTLPAAGENWAQLPAPDILAVGAAGSIGIIDGKLAVSEGQPDDAVFFARIIKE